MDDNKKPVTTDDLKQYGHQWEYRTLTGKGYYSDETVLNHLGQDRWELVAVDAGVMFFRRNKLP